MSESVSSSVFSFFLLFSAYKNLTISVYGQMNHLNLHKLPKKIFHIHLILFPVQTNKHNKSILIINVIQHDKCIVTSSVVSRKGKHFLFSSFSHPIISALISPSPSFLFFFSSSNQQIHGIWSAFFEKCDFHWTKEEWKKREEEKNGPNYYIDNCKWKVCLMVN